MTNASSSSHAKGVALTAFGGIVLSVDAPLMRLGNGDAWSVLALRGLLTVLTALLIWVLVRLASGKSIPLVPGWRAAAAGLFYGVSSSLLPLRESAMLVGGTATRNDRAAESMKVIREEMAKLASDGPTEHEVEEAKRYIIGSYPLRFDTSPKIAGELLSLALRGDTPDFLASRNQRFAAVTLADVRRAAARLFGQPDLLVEAVGRPVGLA